MNKIALAIISASLCIAILIVVLFVHLSPNISNNLPEPIVDVQIIDFKIVAWNYTFTFMILNNGTSDVYNLNLLFSTNSTYAMDRDVVVAINSRTIAAGTVFDMGELFPVGSIEAGETKQIYGIIANDLGDSAKVHGCAFSATLTANDTILDQATIMIL